MSLALGHGVGEVVQLGPVTGDDRQVQAGALAVHERADQLVAVLEVLGVAEPQGAVELTQPVHVRGQHLVVVQPLRVRALVLLEVDVQPRPGLHGRAQLQRRADRIAHVQRAALVRHVHPLGRQVPVPEVPVGDVQVVLEEHPEPDPAGRAAVGGLLQHQAVVARLGQPAQVDRRVVLLGHHQTQDLGVEVAALGQVGDIEPDMAGAADVERRPQVDRWQHGGSPVNSAIDSTARAGSQPAGGRERGQAERLPVAAGGGAVLPRSTSEPSDTDS